MKWLTSMICEFKQQHTFKTCLVFTVTIELNAKVLKCQNSYKKRQTNGISKRNTNSLVALLSSRHEAGVLELIKISLHWFKLIFNYIHDTLLIYVTIKKIKMVISHGSLTQLWSIYFVGTNLTNKIIMALTVSLHVLSGHFDCIVILLSCFNNSNQQTRICWHTFDQISWGFRK